MLYLPWWQWVVAVVVVVGAMVCGAYGEGN